MSRHHAKRSTALQARATHAPRPSAEARHGSHGSAVHARPARGVPTETERQPARTGASLRPPGRPPAAPRHAGREGGRGVQGSGPERPRMWPRPHPGGTSRLDRAPPAPLKRSAQHHPPEAHGSKTRGSACVRTDVSPPGLADGRRDRPQSADPLHDRVLRKGGHRGFTGSVPGQLFFHLPPKPPTAAPGCDPAPGPQNRCHAGSRPPGNERRGPGNAPSRPPLPRQGTSDPSRCLRPARIRHLSNHIFKSVLTAFRKKTNMGNAQGVSGAKATCSE